MDAIVTAVQDCPGRLEIGPGHGVLTSWLSLPPARCVAFEVDERMPAALAESSPAAEIRWESALEADLGAALASLPGPRAVVSNLPYYITGPLLERISQVRDQYEVAVLMMQREVAQRILAPAGHTDRGAASVVLQAEFSIRKVVDAPAGAFLPPPKVESTVLALTPRSASIPEGFSEVVHRGFAQRRKTLANNLCAGYGRSRDEVLGWIAAEGLPPTARAQELTEAQWMGITRRVRS